MGVSCGLSLVMACTECFRKAHCIPENAIQYGDPNCVKPIAIGQNDEAIPREWNTLDS